MKVIHLMGQLMPSGMERMFVSSAPHFEALGVEVVVVGQGEDHPFAAELERAGLRVRSIASTRSRDGRAQWASLLRQERPDVVHLHPEGNYLVNVVTTRRAVRRTPIIRTVHNVFKPSGLGWLRRWIQAKLTDVLVARVVTCGPDVQANERAFGRRVDLIYNWVDDRFYETTDARGHDHEGAPLAVLVGNCSSIKNHERALEPLLRHGYRVAHYGNETGASPTELSLLNTFADNGVLTARGVGDPREALQSADIFVMPSRHEGMSVALAEALVCKVPCLVNRVPGLAWSDGLALVRVVDDTDEAWDAAISDGPAAATASGGSAEVDFSAARGAREYVAVYETSIAK